MFSKTDIEKYYDLSEIHYKRFWDLTNSRSLHYGYWDSTTKNFHEALLNINKVLSGKANITKTDHVLDAGCGIGGSALWLGKEIGCHVKGISLSQKQVDNANLSSIKDGLQSKVTFELRDYLHTGYPDASFDIIWAVESVCHTPDKSAFIQEADRLLKKGGRLVMADFFKKEDLKGADADIISRWAHGWAVQDFSTIKDFWQSLLNTGFSGIRINDATDAIRPSAKRLYLAWYPGKLASILYNLLHRKTTSFGKMNVDTALLQYRGLQKGLWQYKIITAIK